jgi:hypothetical protein
MPGPRSWSSRSEVGEIAPRPGASLFARHGTPATQQRKRNPVRDGRTYRQSELALWRVLRCRS